MNKKGLVRTPKEATELKPTSGRQRNPIPAVLYAKEVSFLLVGTDPKKIQEVAASMHQQSHPYTTGGKESRLVSVVTISEKNPPSKIFDGLIE